MQNFFALIKTDYDRDYTVSLFTAETILTAIAEEFDCHAREHCEQQAAQLLEVAKYKLATKWVLVEFFPYDLCGALAFLKSARGFGMAHELRAVQLVQSMRDDLTNALESSLNGIRAKVAQALLSRVETCNATNRVDYVRNILNAGPEELLQIM
jgi:hypothetical protein